MYHVHCSVYVCGVDTVHGIQSVCSVYGAWCTGCVCEECVYGVCMYTVHGMHNVYVVCIRPIASLVQRQFSLVWRHKMHPERGCAAAGKVQTFYYIFFHHGISVIGNGLHAFCFMHNSSISIHPYHVTRSYMPCIQYMYSNPMMLVSSYLGWLIKLLNPPPSLPSQELRWLWSQQQSEY